MDRSPLPASVDTVCLFIAFLSDRMAFSTISSYVSGLVQFHNQNNFEAPDMSHFAVKQALAGLKRKKEELPRTKAPLLPSQLLAM